MYKRQRNFKTWLTCLVILCLYVCLFPCVQLFVCLLFLSLKPPNDPVLTHLKRLLPNYFSFSVLHRCLSNRNILTLIKMRCLSLVSLFLFSFVVVVDDGLTEVSHS